jgi:hypothetical protein
MNKRRRWKAKARRKWPGISTTYRPDRVVPSYAEYQRTLERMYVAWVDGRDSETARAAREGRITVTANRYVFH